MFWAWEKHQQWRKAMREEGRKEGYAEGWKEGLEEVRQENRKAMLSHLEKVSRETGIPLAELLPPQREQ